MYRVHDRGEVLVSSIDWLDDIKLINDMIEGIDLPEVEDVIK